MDNQEVTVKEEVVQTQDKPAITAENEVNWKLFREQREKERRDMIDIQKQRDESDRISQIKAKEAEALKAAMEALVNKDNQSHSEVDDIQVRVDAAIARERERVENENKEREAKELPSRIQQSFPDFASVCTAENIDYLEFHHPELAFAFKHAPEGFNKWSGIYKAIKKMIPSSNSGKDEKKADQNFNKPQSMNTGHSATGDHAPSRGLDDKRKAENWSRMRARMKSGQ